jgi:TPR repeat protein
MIHGDSALKIERQRMTIYERNAMLEDVAKASIHMHKVFPGYQDIINRKLRVEAGAYCPNADLGHADAQRKIADIYYFRLYGVKKDLQQAYIWYSLSAKGGDYESDVQLEEVISEMSSEELAEAKELLEHWKPGQCKKGLFRNSLGFLQENDGNQ